MSENKNAIISILNNNSINFPSETAIMYAEKGKTIEKTYKALCNDIKKGAYIISSNNSLKGKHFAIIGKNSYEWVLAYLSILASGNVAIPINPDLPTEKISELVKRADIDSIYLDKDIEGIGEETVLLSEFMKQVNEQEENAFVFPTQLDEDCLASIFFTSGTTSKEKGVMLTHKNITSEVEQSSKAVITKYKSTVSFLPFYHSFGLNFGMLLPLYNKTTVFINNDIQKLDEDIKRINPDLLVAVPLLVETLHRKIKYAQKRNQDASCVLGNNLKTIMCGGAHLEKSYISEFKKEGVDIFLGYGTTECFSGCCCNNVNKNKSGSVGVMFPDTEIKISEKGEILIKGPSVMKGYYKDKKATNKAIKNGWYHTNDLGRIDEEGFLFITGRLNNLIICSNGENISPEEIEQKYSKDDGVEEIVVCQKDNAIVAEIFPNEGYEQAYFSNLMHKLNSQEPTYRRISKIIIRNKPFEKTASKKIIRRSNNV